MSAPATFKQDDLARLFAVAAKAGFRPVRATLTRDGVELVFDEAATRPRGGVELD